MQGSRLLLLLQFLGFLAAGVHADCGFGDGMKSCCDPNDGNCMMVGLWVCGSQDTGDCNCGSDPNTLMGGCGGGGAADVLYRVYYLNPNDDQNSKTCDTLGGWRSDDPFNELAASEQGNPAFEFSAGSLHFQVHPDDMQKIGDQSNVRVRLHEHDYCIGGRASGYEYYAWDGNQNQPGDWSLNGQFNIKSIRPYVFGNGNAPENGIGIKYSMFPFYHMMWPYNEINCQGNDYVENVGKGNFGSQDGCVSAVDRAYCIDIDGWGKNDMMDGLDYADQTDTPKQVMSGGGYPMGSAYFGLYDANDVWRCNTNWWDFCDGSSGYDPNKYCLVTRFWDTNNPNPGDWDSNPQTFIAEHWTNIGQNLCGNNGEGFCFNSGLDDQSGDACASGWLTDANQQPLDKFPVQVGQMWTRILQC